MKHCSAVPRRHDEALLFTVMETFLLDATSVGLVDALLHRRCGCLNLVGFVDKSQAMLLDVTYLGPGMVARGPPVRINQDLPSKADFSQRLMLTKAGLATSSAAGPKRG
ncbi:unnamed protein product [Cladocopium goreaui]|uniref:Uncharacterized protein n=1 Tax=Cladocopium goreaui TaxID=2562237 RepID=A0A9P1G6G3_9DINO|nr:unnamed protein product [Cladocopium goreaui]